MTMINAANNTFAGLKAKLAGAKPEVNAQANDGVVQKKKQAAANNFGSDELKLSNSADKEIIAKKLAAAAEQEGKPTNVEKFNKPSNENNGKWNKPEGFGKPESGKLIEKADGKFDGQTKHADKELDNDTGGDEKFAVNQKVADDEGGDEKIVDKKLADDQGADKKVADDEDLDQQIIDKKLADDTCDDKKVADEAGDDELDAEDKEIIAAKLKEAGDE
ncbi:MAG: hypothetical protein JWM80_4049 [Cyanobacteria bacterium RYN_339]|nr:hypothetical protein [Cyanobacteria bacterium RYN_339]